MAERMHRGYRFEPHLQIARSPETSFQPGRQDCARVDRVYADFGTSLRTMQRSRFGKQAQAALGRTVSGEIWKADQARG
jgi:hypothetical protein